MTTEPNNHAKLLTRLRLDPRFLELQEQALAHPEKRQEYILKARKLFGLSPSWSRFLDWYLAYPKMEIPVSGASYQPYIDPVTGKRFYMIPVDPETLLENVKSAYKIIKKQYKEAGMGFDMRQIDVNQTAIEVTALRLHEKGMSNTEILDYLEKNFMDIILTKDDIPILVRAGRQKSKS